jgi:hypothetical protein
MVKAAQSKNNPREEHILEKPDWFVVRVWIPPIRGQHLGGWREGSTFSPAEALNTLSRLRTNGYHRVLVYAARQYEHEARRAVISEAHLHSLIQKL